MPGTIVMIIVSALMGGAVVVKEKRIAEEKAKAAQVKEVEFSPEGEE